MKHIKLSSRITAICALFLAYSTMCAAVNGDKFRLVKSVSELKNGDKVIIVKTKTSENEKDYPSSFALGKSSSMPEYGMLMPGVKISVADGIATITDGVETIELVKSSGKFFMKISSGNYLCMYSKDNGNFIYKDTQSSARSKYGLFDINIYDTSSTKSIGVAGDKIRFGCYNSIMTGERNKIQLYKQIADLVTLSESASNTATIHDNLDKIVDVTLERTLVADKWNTFCSPFTIDCSGGKLCGVSAKIMEFSKVEGNIMFFTEATSMEAGKPYLIKPSESIVNPSFANVKMTAEKPSDVGEENSYKFCGTYIEKAFDEEESKTSLFVNGNAKFSRPKEGTAMKGLRAYFVCASEQLASRQLDINGESTDISSVISDVDKDGNIYNLNGVCVGKDSKGLAKGLYIKNGKTFAVK